MIALSIINGARRRQTGKVGEWLDRHGDKRVRIWSGQWDSYWLPGRCGYTADIALAGVYSLRDAYAATSHCGPEKRIFFEFLKSMNNETKE